MSQKLVFQPLTSPCFWSYFRIVRDVQHHSNHTWMIFSYRPLQPKLQVIHPAGPVEAPQPVPENETSSVDLLLLFGRSEKIHSHVHLSTQRMHQFYVEITPNSHRILLDLMGIYTLESILDPNWPWHPKLSQKASLTSLELPMQLFWSDSAICEVLAPIISLKKVPKKRKQYIELT